MVKRGNHGHFVGVIGFDNKSTVVEYSVFFVQHGLIGPEIVVGMKVVVPPVECISA